MVLFCFLLKREGRNTFAFLFSLVLQTFMSKKQSWDGREMSRLQSLKDLMDHSLPGDPQVL